MAHKRHKKEDRQPFTYTSINIGVYLYMTFLCFMAIYMYISGMHLEMADDLVYYVLLRAAERFRDEHQRLPGRSDWQRLPEGSLTVAS